MKKIITLFLLSGLIFLGACSIKMGDDGLEIKDDKMGKIKMGDNGLEMNVNEKEVENKLKTVEKYNKATNKDETTDNEKEALKVIDQILND